MTAPSSNHEPQEALFDIGEILLVIWNKKFRIVFTSALIFILGAYYVTKLPKIYVANATLLLGGGEANISLPKGFASFAGSDDSQMSNYMQFISSHQFAVKLVSSNDLLSRPSLKLRGNGISEEDQLVHAASIVQGGIQLDKLGDTNVLKVSYESTSGQLAADVVNAVGPTFFAHEAEKSMRRTLDASQWLNNQLSLVQERLVQAESELQNYFTDNNLIDVSSQIALARTEIAALTSKSIINDETLTNTISMLEQVKSSEGDIEGLLSIEFVINNSMVQQVRRRISDEEEDLAEMSNRYKPKHPKYVAQITKLKSVERELHRLIGKLTNALQQQLSDLEKRAQSIQKAIASSKAKYGELGKHEVQITKLRRQVESTQKLYDIFLSRLQETQILRDLGEQEEFAVIDYATVPKSPSKPKVLLLLTALAVFSLFCSISGWLFFHLISDKQNRFRKMLASIDVPILVEVPKITRTKATKSVASLIIEGQKDYHFSESIRTLRTSVMVDQQSKENRIIAVTGVKPGDGKSSIAISLADSFSKLEKSLIIDIDLRQPSVAKAFGLSQKHPGITNFIGQRSTISECLHKAKNSDLVIMPSGPIPQDPMVYLSKPRFASFIRKVGVVYDRVILEVPSLDTVSDALVVSKNVDSVILTCEIEKTDSVDLLEAIQRLRNAGAPLLGVVFNKVKDVRRTTLNDSYTKKLIKKVFRL
jgi:receptor protein-tyrosine kinase